jgi:Zn-dependent protease/CBS domain-containing protein
MPGRSLRIGRIAGIPVGVSPLWLVIVALPTWTLGHSYFPEEVHGIDAASAYALGLASALLLFASILAHEFGHALVARRRGIEVQEIDLWLLGGVSRMRGEAHAPGDELRFALAGPAVTAVVLAVFAAASALLPSGTPAAVRALIDYQAFINGLLLVFNLMPAFPLDGGRVLRSLLWLRGGDVARATEIAAGVGRGFAYVLIGLGGLELVAGGPGGVWLALIGLFLLSAASAEAMGARWRAALAGMRVRELMSAPAITVAATASGHEARDVFLARRFGCLPVVDDGGRALGLLRFDAVRSLSPERLGAVGAAELSEHDPELLIGEDEEVWSLLERVAFGRVGRAVAVDALGRAVGVVSMSDVERALQARMPGPSPRSPGPRSGGAWGATGGHSSRPTSPTR